jgi:glycosyltransferase involved in cell wall biosynthesis
MLAETFYPELGGGESQARLLAERLAERGHDVMVVTRRSDVSLARRDRLGSIRIARVGPAGHGGAKRWPMLLTAGTALLRRHREFDILLVLGFRTLGIAAVPLGALGKPVVFKAESNGEMSGAFFGPRLGTVGLTLDSPPVRLLIGARNRLLRRADAFVAISSAIQAEMEQAGVSPPRIERIPNAVDTEVFSVPGSEAKQLLRSRLGFGTGDLIVSYSGRLVRYKGLPGLLRVWSRIAQDVAGARLVLVGAGGQDIHNCEADLRNYVRENGLAERVVFTGGVQNVPDFLQISDCFVFPTENEAFGIALIEAMACGLAVVASSTGGIPDIVTDGVDGLLVPPGDEPALERAVRAVLSDPAAAKRMGDAARRTVQERFSIPSVVDSYELLLRRCINACA